jgi:hypothetical protein
MKTALIVFALLTCRAGLHAQTLTVCAACGYTTLSAALADPGVAGCTVNTIIVTGGYTDTESGAIQWPYIPCGGTLTVETSAIAQLPPVGYRISPTTFPNYASVLGIVTTSNLNQSVMAFGNIAYSIAAADTTAHNITLSGLEFQIGMITGGTVTSIGCADGLNGVGPTQTPQPGLPQPMARFTQYFITSVTSVDPNDVKVQIATTAGGAPIAIGTTDGINSPSTSTNGWQPFCSPWLNPSNIVLRGIWLKAPDSNSTGTATASGNTITASTGTFPSGMANTNWDHQLLFNGTAYTVVSNTSSSVTTSQTVGTVASAAPWEFYGNYQSPLVQIGGSEPDPRAQPSNITFEQDFIGPDPTWTDRGSPKIAVWADGHDVTVQDSWMEAIAFNDGSETKCVASLVGNGLSLLNDECDSTGAMLLSGGSVGAIPQAGLQNVTMTGNLADIPGWMFYANSVYYGTTAPPNPCYYNDGSGGIFVDKTDPVTVMGSVYYCGSDSAWHLNSNGTVLYRPSPYMAKSRIEFKSINGANITGNIIRGDFAIQDGGNTGCFALVSTEQDKFDATGTAYYQHSNVNFSNNWCDRVWSGLLGGQAGATASPVYSVTGLTAGSGGYTINFSPASPANLFINSCPCPTFSGLSGTGSVPMLNGRFVYAASQPSTTQIVLGLPTSYAQYPANGAWSGGGTVQITKFPAYDTIVYQNNLLTRVSEWPQLSANPSGSVLARPLRMFNSHPGGTVMTHNTIRQDSSGQINAGLYFEDAMQQGGVLFAGFQYSDAVLTDSILASNGSGYASDGGITNDCTAPPNATGYGGFFGAAASFARNVMAGPNAGWPNPGSACSDQAHLLTAGADSGLGFVGSDQSVLTNSKLASTSAFSNANASPKMLSDDGTDLGADVWAVEEATSGAQNGTPSWLALSGLQWDLGSLLGSTGLTANLQGTASWTVTLYKGVARIPANQVASVADTCVACVVNGRQRQIVINGLTPDTQYWFSATDGTMTLVGKVPSRRTPERR